MKATGIKALIGAGALSLAFLGGIALAPSLVSGAAAQTAPQTDQTSTDKRGPHTDLFAVAAQYIGITVDQLRTELGTDKSLADVAVAHGKTRAGLLAALTAAEQQNLADRLAQLVDHKGAPQHRGPGGPGHHGPGFGIRFDFFQAAASYLGISTTDLKAKVQAGQNLGQIAAATAGRSRDGLIAALVTAETAKIDQAVKDGKLTADMATKLKSTIQQRISDLVDGKFPAIRPGFGPRGPQPSASPRV